MKFDFGGYATKNDLKCSDGRTIRQGAFSECNGQIVPLVWQHQHNDVDNVLGHALLEEREDGMYAYCTTNDTPAGQQAKQIVLHGDITSLSIFANHLKQKGNDVVHGAIREVSLVLAGANPGAKIDNLQFAHADGTLEEIDDEAIIYSPDIITLQMSHADEEKEDTNEDSSDEKTIEEIFNTLTEEQKEAVYAIIGAALEEEGASSDEEVSHSDAEAEDQTVEEIFNTLTDVQKEAVYAIVGAAVEEATGGDEMQHSDSEEGEVMKFNAFDQDTNENVLTHDDMQAIFDDAMKSGNGSLRDAALAHGITSIDVLFPEAQTVTPTPATISRNMAWVDSVLNGVRKSPFSRVKSAAINITADEARARGYIKGRQKVEEQIAALHRTTDPQTIYKLQKLDRDDIIDITDFDVVAWIKAEMRVMLNEEIARAILIGDGRSAESNDKIKEDHIRPVWSDNETYAVHTVVSSSLTGSAKAKAFIEAAIRARKEYKGSGSPTLYVGQELLTEMRLIRDTQGYRLYKNDQELADELRVSKIVEVELFDDKTRTVSGAQRELGGIIVNLNDYNVGANRGGEITLFDDFDINYNKYEYLIETRMSGALIQPKSALVIEFGDTSGQTGSTGSTGSTGE